MEKDLISIILPVYNVAPFLDECLKSIVCQTYKKIEIIIIESSSTDNSLDICQKWVDIDNRVRLFTTPKEGLGPARNYGVQMAHGKYVMFVDSDDWVEECFVDEMYRAALENKADMVECSYSRVAVDSGIKSVYKSNSCMGVAFSKEDRLILGNIPQWKILFRKDFLLQNNILQPPFYAEDVGVYALEVMLANQIAGVETPLYCYRKFRTESGSMNKSFFAESYKSLQYLLDQFALRNLLESYRNLLYRHIMRWLSRGLVSLMPQIALNEYKGLMERYEQFFVKNFPNNKRPRIFLVGSYNLTKILQKGFILENPYYRFQFTSLPAIMTEGSSVPPKHRNPYRQYMLAREFERSFWVLLDKEKPEYLVIDFIEERHNLLKHHDYIYTNSDALFESDFHADGCRTIKRDSEECQSLWEEACLSFIKRLQQQFQPDHVILVENLLTERHGDVHGSQEFEQINAIKNTNRILQNYYAFFKKHFEGIQCINMTEDPLYITDDQYEYGCYPWHLNELMNRRIGEAMIFEWRRE